MLPEEEERMGVSAVGAGISVTAVRHVTATILVFLALFYFFYGPPLTPAFADRAQVECNQQTGSSYRNYRLEWRTTTYDSVHPPTWVCHDLRDPEDTGTSLGWWVGF
jgi:hypothetical protein